MKATLFYRRLGVHTRVKDCLIPDIGIQDEDAMLASLPEGFLPVPANRVLLMEAVPGGSKGVAEPVRFREWGKYFDCYSLELSPND